MKYKAIAFDLDGTLLNSNAEINQENLKIIKKLDKLGYQVILATGRPLVDTLPIAKKIKTISYLVCNNGAIIYDFKKQRCLFLAKLDYLIYKKILQLGKKTKSFFALHTYEGFYHHYFFDESNPPGWINYSIFETRGTNEEISVTNKKAKKETITQISLKNDRATIKTLYSQLFKEFKNKYALCISSLVYLDVNLKNTNKLSSLKKICQINSFEIEEVIAFGDSGNDVAMLSGCGLGIAMGNATEDIKSIAKMVIGDHDTDTIAHTLIKILKLV